MFLTLPDGIEGDVDQASTEWDRAQKTQRLWAKDASLWTNGDESKWMDWLNIVDRELARLDLYHDLRADIESAGFTDILLMGMGGSSLCPEVLAKTFGRANFHILDSTVPAQVSAVEKSIDIENTLFIVASKSGSTLEPNCFKQYFFDLLVSKVGRELAGRQFIAITDPGSKMEKVAKEDGFRHIFYGEPQIGGRFSALSAFGLTAAAAMGLDVDTLLRSSNEMVRACGKTSVTANPGVLLGIVLGICHRHGRNKLTIFTSPEISSLGAWLEQIVSESTGKNGIAIIPVDGEPALQFSPHSSGYSSDRVFAYVYLKGQSPEIALAEAGHPVIQLELNDVGSLGQEFFRWEIATAVAGSIIGINPFDQPDVESAKIEARKITDEYERTGELPKEEAFLTTDGLSLFTCADHAAYLTDAGSTVPEIIKAHLDTLRSGDYFALLAYLEMKAFTQEALTKLRTQVLHRYGNATCLGFGPRFLHSTGQAYKGGPNTGVFLQITADDDFDLQVPGQRYTFGVVKAAQARGDFQVLLDRGRRALRVHISGDIPSGLSKLTDILGPESS